jgi:hypothetical protein
VLIRKYSTRRVVRVRRDVQRDLNLTGNLQRTAASQVLGEAESSAAGQRCDQRRFLLGFKEVEVGSALVLGGRLGRGDAGDPLGCLVQHVACHHTRNDDVAALGELAHLRIAQHPANPRTAFAARRMSFCQARRDQTRR